MAEKKYDEEGKSFITSIERAITMKAQKMKPKKNFYEMVAHRIPEETATINRVLATFAHNELCTDPSFFREVV